MVEQAVPSNPQAPHRAHLHVQPLEEPAVLQYMRPGGRTAHESPCKCRPQAGAAVPAEEPMVGRRATGAAAHGDLCWSSAILKDVVGTHDGSGLEELPAVGSPRGINLGRMATLGRDPTWSRGRLAMKGRWRLSILD